MVAAEVPQGFVATILAWKAFANPPIEVTPQEELVKVCTILAGGGCIYTSLGEPSLYDTVYMVPGGFEAVLVMGKVRVAGAHKPTVPPGFARPTDGFEPLYTL
jgi:hypothetical protein